LTGIALALSRFLIKVKVKCILSSKTTQRGWLYSLIAEYYHVNLVQT
jgi:hypothetical protein